jgi:sugar/nucleoside kinase (ribokinase family)
MDKRFDLVVIGEINPDLILTGDVTPAFGQVEKMVTEAALTIGSSACIFACGAARLGLRVAFIGKIGDDVFGRFMSEQLAGRGVDTSGLRVVPDLQTGLSVILSRGSDRAILTYAGAMSELQFSEIDLGLVSRARHLHIGSYYLLSRLQPDVPRLFRTVRESGLTISLDTNYDPTGRWEGVTSLLDLVDVFFPNEIELAALSGETEVEAGLVRLSRPGLVLAAKLGARGGAVRHAGQTFFAPALPVTVVDATGAGDSFDAGFLYGFLQGWEPRRCLRLACACGSLSTRQAGGTTAQPTLAEALAALPPGDESSSSGPG